MYKHFSTEFFVNNRARLQELFVGTAPIVITANGVMQRNSDSVYPFRQDSSFWYLTGIERSDMVLVIDKSKEYLILPEQHDFQDIFNGVIDQSELAQVSGIGTIYDNAEGWRKLANRLKRVKHVATLAANPPYIKDQGFYTNPARTVLIERLKLQNDQLELLDLRPQLSLMRMIKQPAELAAIQSAIDTTIKAIKHVQKRSYQHEYEVEADVTHQFRKSGATGHGFSPIVSAGARACVLHQDRNNGPIGAKDLLTLDIGAEVDNYSADITRTFSPAKTPSKRQRQIHEAVLAVQDYAFSLVKPGALLKDNEQKIEHFMGEKLRELGLIKIIDKPSVRAFYPHSSSHHLGLDVHDVADYKRPLEPGMVITVEPGIYIPAEGIGVRIEDDVLITKDGHKVLTSRLPRDIC